MFYELIYTRCRKGVDILRGQAMNSDGFKVFACSPALMEKDACDLALLQSAAQLKLSFADPAFMDEAYVYYTPDLGTPFLTNFHPVHFDMTDTGDFAKRPGNFLNDLLVGDFSRLYPFRLFGNGQVWKAREHQESYYYSANPAEFPLGLDESGVSDGPVTREEVRAFVADGRQSAFRKAVAFLLEQYALPPNQRKYLLILDESSENIERWIAALELAFSPKMASGLSFATRMPEFLKNNRYAVGANGAFRPQFNAQDPSQSLRYRAMVIGVCAKDRAVFQSVRPLPASPYVTLDGLKKQAMFDADMEAPYFSAVASMDEKRADFCERFLQAFDIFRPDAAIFTLYRAWTLLRAQSVSATDLTEALSLAAKYPFDADAPAIRDLYRTAKSRLEEIAARPPEEFLSVADWLNAVGKKIGDADIGQTLSGAARDLMRRALYGQDTRTGPKAVWKALRAGKFASDAEEAVLDRKAFREHVEQAPGMGRERMTETFSVILGAVLGRWEREWFRECELIFMPTKEALPELVRIRRNGYRESQRFWDILRGFLWDMAEACAKLPREDGIEALRELVALAKDNRAKLNDMIRGFAASGSEENPGFLVDYLLRYGGFPYSEALSSADALEDFCQWLRRAGLSEYVGHAAQTFAERADANADFGAFLAWATRQPEIDESGRETLFCDIDRHISLVSEADASLARLIQEKKPESAICARSAHVLALQATAPGVTASLSACLPAYERQGFPGIADSAYAQALASNLTRSALSDADAAYISRLLLTAPGIYLTAYFQALTDAVSGFTVSPRSMAQWGGVADALGACREAREREKAVVKLAEALSAARPGRRKTLALKDAARTPAGAAFLTDAFAQAARMEGKRQDGGPAGWLFGRRK